MRYVETTLAYPQRDRGWFEGVRVGASNGVLLQRMSDQWGIPYKDFFWDSNLTFVQ
jgi:hypothetical protein